MEWRLYPLDVWLFRGLAPMNAGESAIGESYFPPTPEVVQGFIRTALLQALGTPLDAYGKAAEGGAISEEIQRAIDLIGRGSEDMGRVDIRGPYLIRQLVSGELERWFPAPRDIFLAGDRWRAALPDAGTVECDLGKVSFLVPPQDTVPAADQWISEAGLTSYLKGDDISADQVKAAEDFYRMESRIGIARNRATRTAEDGMLYASTFVRLAEAFQEDARVERVGLGIQVTGIDEYLQQPCAGLRRFGGEGRLADVEIHPGEVFRFAPPASSSTHRLLLLTPARWGGSWLPGNPDPINNGWPVQIGDVQATVAVAALGKSVRIGGWDMVRRRAKPAVACVPAGSVFYIRDASPSAIPSWHDQKIDNVPGIGFGHALLGAWDEGGNP